MKKKGRLNKRAFLQIPFSWLFAIIVGAFILFLAIYAATQILKTEEAEIDAKTGKEFGIILNPLETSFETSTTTFITMPVETRIINRCNTEGFFGKQVIQMSQKSFNKWTQTNINIVFPNKYIFSEKEPEGKKFYVFSKPFDFPFKVADLIYLTSSKKQYCFAGLNNIELEDIKEELEDLNQTNIILGTCPGESVKICFTGFGNCDINVNYNARYVEKQGDRLFFETDALMYAAIFADKDVYECQLRRLMQRTGQLALLYKNKAVFISRTGCNSNLNADLTTLSSAVGNLNAMKNIADNLEEGNSWADCKLW